jgi:uncharacterized membrane protein
MNERELREAKERRSAGLAFQRQQEAEAEGEARRARRAADALLEEVVEVNGEGQPKLARVRDRETNAVGVIEMVGGYRAPSGAVSAYDPMDALKRDDGGY